MKNYNILIVDENFEFTDLLTKYLKLERFKVVCEHDGQQALKRAMNQSFDAIIMDLVLPNLTGFKVLKKLREDNNKIPIIILTGRRDDIDAFISFDAGADDYLLKPCNPHELIARLRAILQRTQKIIPDRPILEYQEIRIDCAKRLVFLHNNPVDLTNTEFNILEMLIKSPGQAFSKEELTEYVLGRKFTAYDRSIDVHISNLRNKLGSNALGDDLVKTKRGFGYLFNISLKKK